MPVNNEQRKWLEGRLPEFMREKISGLNRSYLPKFYEDFNVKFPVIPTTAQVTEAGGFEIALKTCKEKRKAVSLQQT